MKSEQVHVVLDTETTGLSFEKDRIVEIGAIKLVNKKPVEKFHCYINPGRAIGKEAIKVHGITDDFVRDKPSFAEIQDAFLLFIDRSTLVIHNASFDVGFLDAELQRNGKNIALGKICNVVDTVAMARKMFPGQKASLDALCSRFNIDLSVRELHGALLDADLLVKVYLQLTTHQTSFEMKNSNKNSPEMAVTWSKEGVVVEASADEVKDHQQWCEEFIKG